eukprot:g5680.t1
MMSKFRTLSTRLRFLTGFVFDIDGVLLKGGTVIPRADEAVQQLYESDRQTIKYPVCFLTNGGGVTESQKANQLSSLLGVKITQDQVVLCHTPMRDLSTSYGNKPVLVCGKGDLSHIASNYGFQKAVTTQELFHAMPTASPFTSTAPLQPPDGVPCPIRDLQYGTQDAPFASVMVLTDPLDWARDIQLMTDVISSHGVPGRQTEHHGDWPVGVYVGSGDLLWANEFPIPRYGLGAFTLAFRTLFEAYTGTQPNITYFGKPTLIPFRLTEKLLMKQMSWLGGEKLERIFMVGDNPAADVRGARNCGKPWVPVLVETGVYRSQNQRSLEQDTPDVIYRDVFEFITKVL